MANSKARCRGCHDYFPPTQFWRDHFHAEECLRQYQQRSRQRVRAKARRDKPRPDRQPTTFTRELKRQVRQRDGDRCRRCSQAGFQVHHVRYLSQGGANEAWNLVFLCLECHAWAHSNKKAYQPIIQTALWLEYFHGAHLTIPETERWLAAVQTEV